MSDRRTSAISVAELGSFWRPSLTSFAAAWVATGFLSLCAAAFLLAAQRTMTGHGPRTPVPATNIEAYE
jgi:hypothetical protein